MGLSASFHLTELIVTLTAESGLAVGNMHFFFVETLHDILHNATTWLTVGLVLGSVTSIYIFYRLFESDLFSAD
jgi:hypothetical protein